MIGNIIDSVISAVNPLAGVRRMQARRLMRSYQGAEPSRISNNRNVKNNPADQELLGPFGADRLRAWGRDLARNNAYAWGVIDTIVSSVVGCGIKAQSTFETVEGEDVENVNDERDRIWAEWAETCDINGQLTLDEIQALAQREIVEAGEILIRFIRLPSQTYKGIYRTVPLALEVIEADRLAADKDTYQAGINRGDGHKIVRGVELDDLGKPIAYWIYKDHPNAPYAVSRTPERIPANEIRHLFRQDRIGQTRGVSWFAPALSWIRDLGTYVDNELAASAVASCFTMAIKTDTPIGSLADPDGQDAFDSSGNRIDALEPGMVMRLAPGESVEGINPGRPNTGAKEWITLILRGIAVGTGLSYETVARDYSQTSYSSSRTSQLEDRRRFRCWQQYLIRHLLQPTWDAFCDQAALSQLPAFPSAADLLDNRRTACPVEWLTPDWDWVDPGTEQQTAESALNSFTDTYASVLGSRGKSFRTVFYQRAKEDRLRKKLGLLTNEEKQIEVSAAQSGMGQGQAGSTEATKQATSGVYMGLSTQQWNRNRKAIQKTLDELIAGTMSEAAARVFLKSTGMPDEDIEILVADTRDGAVETELPADGSQQVDAPATGETDDPPSGSVPNVVNYVDSISRGWVTTEDDQRLYIEDEELKTKPGGKVLSKKAASQASRPTEVAKLSESIAEHKPKLEKFRKSVIEATQKAEAKFDKVEAKHEVVYLDTARKKADLAWTESELRRSKEWLANDPTNLVLQNEVEKYSFKRDKEILELKSLESQEKKSAAAWQKAQQERRYAVSIAIEKESRAVDAEDGIPAEQIKQAINDIKSIYDSDSHIAEWAKAKNIPSSAEIAAIEGTKGTRKKAEAFLLNTVNATIHADALKTPVEYADEHTRAFAKGGILELLQDGEIIATERPERSIGASALVNSSTLAHEYGHHIESGNKEASDLAIGFLKKRTKNETPVQLSKQFPAYSYDEDEKGSPDSFAKAISAVYGWEEDHPQTVKHAHYAGKVYGEKEDREKKNGWRWVQSTEVVSIGIELMNHDPVAFAKADPEWFDLIGGICTGRLLTKTRKDRKR